MKHMHGVNNLEAPPQEARLSRQEEQAAQGLGEFDPHGGHDSGAVQESLVQRHTVTGKNDANQPANPRGSLGEGAKQSAVTPRESQAGAQVSGQTRPSGNSKPQLDEPRESQAGAGEKSSTKKTFQDAPGKQSQPSSATQLAPQAAPVEPKKPKTPKGGQAKPHWETLYDLSKIKTETREIILKEKERQEEKFLKECTFTPNIIGEAKLLQERNPMETYKRNQEWKQKKEEKRQQLAETQHQREEYLCTFKPVLTKNTETLSRTKDYNISHQIGIEKYLERQQLARAEKERVERVMNGVNGVKGRPDGRGGYAAKFHRIKQKEDEDVVLALRQTNFAQGALILHNYLNMMDLKF